MRHVGMLALGVLVAGRLLGVDFSVPEDNLIVNPEFSLEETFSDTSSDNGEELSLNAVAVKPYFAE